MAQFRFPRRSDAHTIPKEDELRWVSNLSKNLMSSSYGAGLEMGWATEHRASPLLDHCFFEAIKQNPTVKIFVGTSENALQIQIWIALVALLLLKLLHHLFRANWSLSNLASLLRPNLFAYRELTKWLNYPLENPPLPPPPEQLILVLSWVGQVQFP
ncbi:MAG: hypothetical protein QM757_22260 [Paludibaculum sp.]